MNKRKKSFSPRMESVGIFQLVNNRSYVKYYTFPIVNISPVVFIKKYCSSISSYIPGIMHVLKSGVNSKSGVAVHRRTIWINVNIFLKKDTNSKAHTTKYV